MRSRYMRLRAVLLILALLMYSVPPAQAGVLLTSTDSIEMVTSSTADVDYTVGWADATSTAFTPGTTTGTVAAATTTTILAAPSASTYRSIRALTIRNVHASTSNTITVQMDVSGTNRLMYKVTLAAGESLVLDEQGRFNYYSASGLAMTNQGALGATYITQTADSSLTAEQATGSLATGLLKNTTTTGVLSAYGGTSCTNQFPRSLDASGAATCASVNVASGTNDLTGTLSVANGGTGLATTTTGAVITGGNGTANMVQLADVATGSALVSGGTSTIPAWSAAGTCTSSASTTCTISSQRSGCLPVCSMTTSVSTTFRAAISATTITCTFGTSGTNTCNCHCF